MYTVSPFYSLQVCTIYVQFVSFLWNTVLSYIDFSFFWRGQWLELNNTEYIWYTSTVTVFIKLVAGLIITGPQHCGGGGGKSATILSNNFRSIINIQVISTLIDFDSWNPSPQSQIIANYSHVIYFRYIPSRSQCVNWYDLIGFKLRVGYKGHSTIIKRSQKVPMLEL